MFTFKQFVIHQDRTAMKVGTDGVLLGAWVDIFSDDKRILDIGTGTGLIALMMAQRSPSAVIDAVEIEADSASQARENIDNSEWSQRINIHNINISKFNNSFKYDLIVSNPPFFNDSLLSPDACRTNARHTVSLSFGMLIDSVVRLLSPKGRFALILPTSESERFNNEAKGKLFLNKTCRVYSRVGGDCKRVMCEYSLSKTELLTEYLAIREADRNEYTNEYKSITSDFYLKF